jgi:hypothetical protein
VWRRSSAGSYGRIGLGGHGCAASLFEVRDDVVSDQGNFPSRPFVGSKRYSVTEQLASSPSLSIARIFLSQILEDVAQVRPDDLMRDDRHRRSA